MAPRRDFRQTKIVCTLGPASSTPELIEQLAAAGMNIARLNMSHGDHASHLQVIQVVQKLNERLNHPIALLLDLQGPAIRTGDRLGHLSLEVGQEFHVTVGPTENPEERTIHVDYQDIVHQLKVGDRITVDNGLINLDVWKYASAISAAGCWTAGSWIAQAHQSSRRADQPAVDLRPGRCRHPFRGGARHRLPCRVVRAQRRGSARRAADHRRGRRAPHAHHRQDREPGGHRQSRRDHRRGRWHHGGSGRSRRRGGVRDAPGGPARHGAAQCDRRQAGDRGDPPVGIDDRQPDADPGRGHRRRQRGVRTGRRGDAQRGKRRPASTRCVASRYSTALRGAPRRNAGWNSTAIGNRNRSANSWPGAPVCWPIRSDPGRSSS